MPSTTIIYQATCPLCGKVNKLNLNAGAYYSWQAGAYIQDCFPELTTDQRELIQTGIDPECWNKMFGEIK